jgi:hypothetical protein
MCCCFVLNLSFYAVQDALQKNDDYAKKARELSALAVSRLKADGRYAVGGWMDYIYGLPDALAHGS